MDQGWGCFLGVDIGGTKIAGGLIDTHGRVLSKTRMPMIADAGAEQALACVHRVVDQCLSENPNRPVSGIGLSSAGIVDPRTGTLVEAANLPCWRDFPLASRIEAHYGFPTLLHNDANAAGMAEALWGAGAGFPSVFYASIGTGIGTAFVLNSTLYLGRTGAAGEGGHMTIDVHGEMCRCGKRGCIETLASGPAIAARARRKIAAEPHRGKTILQGLKSAPLCSEAVVQAWEQGDLLATEVLQETADLLAVWFGNIADLLEPSVIVVGGGVSGVIERWFERIRSQLPRWSVNSHCRDIPLVRARYGEDAGIVGAAALCFHNQSTSSSDQARGGALSSIAPLRRCG
jgi:glucokinase